MLLHEEAMVKLHVAAKGFVLSRRKFPEIWIQRVEVGYKYDLMPHRLFFQIQLNVNSMDIVANGHKFFLTQLTL